MIYILCNFTAYFIRFFMQKTVKQSAVYLHNTIYILGYILGRKYHIFVLVGDNTAKVVPPPHYFYFALVERMKKTPSTIFILCWLNVW